MKSMLTFFLVLLAFCVSAQDYPESYMCYQSGADIVIDGLLSDEEWGKANWTSKFVDIEGDKKPKPKYKTRVKMLWDENYFYIAAELQEPHIWAKLKQRDTVIFYDNDFEVFIDPQGDNHRYYEFEINALNTIWDLMLAKPYRDGAPAINAWDIKGLKSAVKVYGTLNNPKDKDKKWTLEIAFPWEVLKECAYQGRKPKSGEQWRVNFSRVNWEVEHKDGKYLKKINPKTEKVYPEYNWVWSPQGVIAMHQPETWGYVEFTDEIVGGKQLTPRMDQDYPAKIELIRLYSLEKKMYKKYGKYFNKITSNYPVLIETTSKQFLISIQSASGKTWYINQESKLWTE
ncbi:carbohydrate-binding family 9-like protein [Marinifilum sp. D737]|uniref:carbohydrate-binding family 9-like protein n=1 Tax=Marinifilum sp. D737 TaxID=2969628 RepID=UPI002273C165|nr:carbohydrate-binding family 9-like protein [Marinifilum sp. D737]MCY1633662.1 carbohydrate-binding family 9-like protein [Marinifilum sp. D737]